MSVKIDGFDEVASPQETADGDAVPIEELFPADFMRTHTEFESIGGFFDASPWTVDSRSDFETIPKRTLDRYVDSRSGFNSWESMVSAGAREWASRELVS